MATKDTTLDSKARIAVLSPGLFSRVARELGLDRSHVRRVALGQRKSDRVLRAINRELKRLEREARGAA